MGVELGKVLAKNILSQLEKPEDVKNHDSSVCRSVSHIFILLTDTAWYCPQTTGLIHYYQKHRKELLAKAKF